MKLKEILAPLLSANELRFLVGSYDTVGDIAIIIIPEQVEEKEHLVVAAILANDHRIKVVAKRATHYGGEYRTLPVKIIGGEIRSETLVKEFGVRLRLDIGKVYFSVRSGNERKRLASLVQPGENVLVLFSGIGPYPLMISKHSRAQHIVGIEKNPVAHEYALSNLKLNKKLDNIRLILGDVKDILPQFTVQFDRVVMVLPKSAESFLAAALQVLKPGGHLHFYDMQHVDYFGKSVTKVRAVCEEQKRRLLISKVTSCGHCAPRTFRVCVDARIS